MDIDIKQGMLKAEVNRGVSYITSKKYKKLEV